MTNATLNYKTDNWIIDYGISFLADWELGQCPPPLALCLKPSTFKVIWGLFLAKDKVVIKRVNLNSR